MKDPGYREIRHNPSFEVSVGGAPLAPGAEYDLLAVSVEDYLEGAATFSLTVDIWDAVNQRYKWIDEDLYREGAKVEIKLGYVGSLVPMIRGEVVGLEPQYHHGATPTLVVRGYDRMNRIYRGKLTRSYTDMRDSEVATLIAREIGVRPEVDDTEVVHAYLLQNNLSSIDFLKERARRIGFEFNISEERLRFRKKKNGEPGTLDLEYGETVKAFYPCLSTVGQAAGTVVQGWDPYGKQPIREQAQSGDLASKMGGDRYGPDITKTAFAARSTHIVQVPVSSRQEARQIALGRLGERSLRFIRGHASAIGIPELRAGLTVTLSRLGERFSGQYYVTASDHRVDSHGYTTRFCFERCAS